jgi:hypothetical protein
MPATRRDDGNRWLFGNANSGWGQASKPPCALVLTGGAAVDAVWRRLLDRAGPGCRLPLTGDPDLHLRVDGARVDASARTPDAYVFALDRVPCGARLVSRAAAPQEPGLARDPRCLGVAVRRVVVRQGTRFRVFPAGETLLIDGHYPFEADAGVRWTNGDAELPAEMFAGFDGPVEVVIRVWGATPYIADSGYQQAA